MFFGGFFVWFVKLFEFESDGSFSGFFVLVVFVDVVFLELGRRFIYFVLLVSRV